MVKKSPVDAGDTLHCVGSVPGQGRFHVPGGQLSPCAITTATGVVVGSHHSGKPAHHDKE